MDDGLLTIVHCLLSIYLCASVVNTLLGFASVLRDNLTLETTIFDFRFVIILEKSHPLAPTDAARANARQARLSVTSCHDWLVLCCQSLCEHAP